MDAKYQTGMAGFLGALGLAEEPLVMTRSEREPGAGFAPQPNDLPTAEKEARGEVDWGRVFGSFSCVLGKLWLARRKKAAAWFSAERFGCPGAAFFLGYLKPQTDFVVRFVSTGIPDVRAGEHYADSPEAFRRYLEFLDPPSAKGRYTIFKPLSALAPDEKPLLAVFFARPEIISGLHQLAAFVTNDPQAVVSPFGAGCANLVSWPLKFLAQGELKAVLGGWDPSCRKFLAVDEISFTVPMAMLEMMLERWPQSFLTTPTWAGVKKRIARSQRAWRRGKPA